MNPVAAQHALQPRAAEDAGRHHALRHDGLIVRALNESDLRFVREEIGRNWTSTQVWSIRRMYQADELPGFIAEMDGERAGLATYCIVSGGVLCELVTISSRVESHGVGAGLLDAVVGAARDAGCARLMLTTSNDNLRAMRFYQKRGWRLCSIHAGSIDRARPLVPDKFPLIGMNGIPLHDEVELELWIDQRAAEKHS